MSPSINDPHLIIVSRDHRMAWPLLNSCGSLSFLGLFLFTKKSLVCLLRRVPETLPGFLSYANSQKSNILLSQDERERGENGRYQNHFLDIKIQRKRKKRNNCRFRKPCVSLNTNTQRISTHQNPNKRFWTPRYLLTQGIST